LNHLLKAAKTSTTWKSYERSLQSFQQFHRRMFNFHPVFPYTSRDIAAFVSYLHLHGHAPSTIATHLSGISHYHKLHGLPDPTQSYQVRQAQRGGRRLHPQNDQRLPITKEMLHQLFHAIPQLAPNAYMAALYQALFLLMFHGFLRVGEVTVSGSQANHTLTMDQIRISYNRSQPIAMTVNFNSFKHSNGSQAKLRIPAQQFPCPVQSLLHFLRHRGTNPGHLFVTPLKQTLSRHQLAQFLHLVVQYAGYNPVKYNTHSFRIGAATHAASQGFTPLQIQQMGRWKSDAFYQYLRPQIMISV